MSLAQQAAGAHLFSNSSLRCTLAVHSVLIEPSTNATYLKAKKVNLDIYFPAYQETKHVGRRWVALTPFAVFPPTL